MQSNECKRCGHIWNSRVENPVACPHCKNRTWNRDIYKYPNKYTIYEDHCKIECFDHKTGVPIGYALIDLDDIPLCKPYKWNVRHDCILSDSKKRITMHHLLLGNEPSKLIPVDHINRNPWDNRRANLRIVPCSINNHNVSIKSNNKSGIKGVSRCKGTNRWKAQIRFNGVVHYLGLYKTIEEAQVAYKEACYRFYGDAGSPE